MQLNDAIINKVYTNLKKIHYPLCPNICGTPSYILDHYMKQIDIAIKLIPIKKIKISSNQHPWINGTFIQMTKRRDLLFKKAKLKNDALLLHEAKAMSNKCTSYSRFLHQQYITTKLSSNSSVKNTWNIINSYINKKEKNEFAIKIDDTMVTDQLTLANAFNTYFIDTVDNLINTFDKEAFFDFSALNYFHVYCRVKLFSRIGGGLKIIF